MRKFACILLLLFAGRSLLNAQSVTASGIVLDSSGAPVAGASITVSGSNRGTATSPLGSFSIAVQKSQSLTVSAVGYDKLIFHAGTRSPAPAEKRRAVTAGSSGNSNGYTKRKKGAWVCGCHSR